jgi:hypothetical protein
MKSHAMHSVDPRLSGEPSGKSTPLQTGRLFRSIGAMGLGALALGAFAIGALAISRLAIGSARIRRMEIDELTVRSLRITESLHTPPDAGSESSRRPAHPL